MSDPSPHPELLSALARITKGRAKIVVDHILRHGSVSTEELEQRYGLRDAASAARDVKDAGIPLVSARGKSKTGRQIAIYSFGDPSKIRADRIGGRTAFSKRFKKELVQQRGDACEICGTPFDTIYLQIDHRVPYQIAGDDPVGDRVAADYMLLCGSCQRGKSWSCEHCENWREGRQPQIRKTCYWASPQRYTHIALRDHRRLEIVWVGEREVNDHAALRRLAASHRLPMPSYAKSALAEHVRRDHKSGGGKCV